MSASESYKDGDGGKCLCANCIGRPNSTGNNLSPVGESVKPCPHCGKIPVEEWGQKNNYFCFCIGGENSNFIPLKEWNNAWAHRRIAELESQLTELRKQLNISAIVKEDLEKFYEQQLKEAKVKEIKQNSEIEASNILISCLEQQVVFLQQQNTSLRDENTRLTTSVREAELQTNSLREKLNGKV